MTSPRDLQVFLDSGEERYVTSFDGRPIEGTSEGSSEAIVFVQSPSDAIKAVVGSQVVESLDRDGIWQLIGFDLSRSVVEKVILDEPQEHWLAALERSDFVVEFIEILSAP